MSGDENRPQTARQGGLGAPSGGSDGSPYVRRRPDRQFGDRPDRRRLSRRCRAVRGRRAPSAALLPRRRVRAEHLDHGHRAVAELLVEPAYDGGREQPELGRPGGRVGAHHELAVGERLGAAVRADLVPTSSAQRANIAATFRSTSQPWSSTSRPSVASRVCGSRSSGWAPDTRPVRGARSVRRRRRSCGPASIGRSPGPACGRGRARRRRARGSPPAASSSGLTGHLARRPRRSGCRPAPPGRRRRPPP